MTTRNHGMQQIRQTAIRPGSPLLVRVSAAWSLRHVLLFRPPVPRTT
jgi:hypothetical protein